MLYKVIFYFDGVFRKIRVTLFTFVTFQISLNVERKKIYSDDLYRVNYI